MTEIITLIINLIFGSGIVATLIFFNANKRKMEAQAFSQECDGKERNLDIEHKTIIFLQNQLSEAYDEIDKMQNIINQKRDQIIQLIKQTKDLEISLIETQQLLIKNQVYEQNINR